MSSGNFVSINHGVGLNQHHFEWCPKYRFRCMRKEKIAKEMGAILQDIAREKGIIIHKMAIDADHVHLFVSLPFSMSVSMALQLLKGGSSYRMFRLHPNFRKRYPKGHFWSPGHFSRSISNVTAKAVAGYIENHDDVRLGQSIDEAKEECRQLRLFESV